MPALEIVRIIAGLLVWGCPVKVAQGPEKVRSYNNFCRAEASQITKFPVLSCCGLTARQNDQADITLFDDPLDILDPADHSRSIDLHPLG